MRVKKKLVVVGLALFSVPLLAQAPPANQDPVAVHTRLAQQYLSQKQPRLAIPEYESVIALDPRNVDAQGNLGVLLFFQGDYAKAVPHLQAAFDLQPNLGKIEALLGMAEKRTGDAADAGGHLESSFARVEDKKLKVEIGLELVEMYAASRELDKASAIVNAMRQADPANPVVLYTAYRVYSDLSAEAMLSLALAAPNSAQMHQLMAHEESKQGNVAAAQAQYEKALQVNPKLPGIHFEIGELLNASEDAQTKTKAEAEYRAAVAENVMDEKAECRLGDLADHHGDATRALDYYTAAVRLQPDDAEANFGMAKVLIALNQQARALPILERAVELEPTNAAAHFRLSTLYREMGRTADAQREVEQYKRYKALKENLEALFKEMRLHPAGLAQEEKFDEK